MTTPRKDYLGSECDLGGMAIGDFQEQFCASCTQPECSRSLYGKSKFDQRVQNWEEKLFLNVPKMDASDPRYTNITGIGSKFISIGQTSSSDWGDPGEQEKSPMIIVPRSIEAKRNLPMVNTPFQNGKMLGGKETPSTPKADPWAAPEPNKDPVVKPGTKIKLGK